MEEAAALFPIVAANMVVMRYTPTSMVCLRNSLVNCGDFGTIPQNSDAKGIIGNIHHGCFEAKKSQ